MQERQGGEGDCGVYDPRAHELKRCSLLPHHRTPLVDGDLAYTRSA